jgi:hypothetical protein
MKRSDENKKGRLNDVWFYYLQQKEKANFCKKKMFIELSERFRVCYSTVEKDFREAKKLFTP